MPAAAMDLPMRSLALLLTAAAFALTSAALAAKPVEVTRFHTPETLVRLGPGEVTVAASPGIDDASLETRTWLDAVAGALSEHGFTPAGGGAARLAEVRLTRDTVGGRRAGSPVGVGVGVGTGSGDWYGGGTHVGVGVDFGLGGGRGETIESELSVVIRDAATRAPLWEGRAVTSARAGSREAAPGATVERLAQALFSGFPGRSGATIEVR